MRRSAREHLAGGTSHTEITDHTDITDLVADEFACSNRTTERALGELLEPYRQAAAKAAEIRAGVAQALTRAGLSNRAIAAFLDVSYRQVGRDQHLLVTSHHTQAIIDRLDELHNQNKITAKQHAAATSQTREP